MKFRFYVKTSQDFNDVIEDYWKEIRDGMLFVNPYLSQEILNNKKAETVKVIKSILDKYISNEEYLHLELDDQTKDLKLLGKIQL
jgi:hypothetical protein